MRPAGDPRTSTGIHRRGSHLTDLRSRLQDTLGNAYTIGREIAGGGMSRIFIAEEHSLNRSVVVKVLPPELGAAVNVDRFKREIQLSAKLQHPHIVPVLGTGEMDGVPYYTMPFVEGESLRARLARAGAMNVAEAISILRDVAKALAFAHERGVVHRDIKPDNVLLAGGSATVADFGIAKALRAARSEAAPQGTITLIGTALGTPAYVAPEQAAGDPSTDHRADIYSFGCLAYELLAGEPPFAGRSPQRLLTAQMSERPYPIGQRRPDLPAALSQLVMQCLEKDAGQRPQNASELVRVLETVTTGRGHLALPAVLLGGPGMFRKALVWYAATFVAVFLVVRTCVMLIGLPEWVLPAAMVLMLMGLPVILFTAYVQRVARRAIAATPTYTPGGSPSVQHRTLEALAIKASPHVSWRRAGKIGALTIAGFVLLVAAFMSLRAAGIGPFGSLLASGRIQQREPLLLTDFSAVNGDTTLGPVISQAVRSQLSQSNVLAIVSRDEASNALERMHRPRNSRVDLGLARSLAAREGIRAIVDGEVASVGNGFLVTVRLVTADSQGGADLASFTEGADGPAQLIDAVDAVARKLRSKVGESLRDVRASPPLAQVTTRSIDALRKYTEATRATGSGDFLRAIALAREAIALDSDFALAYCHLSESLYNAGFLAAADSAITRAFALRDRLTTRERLSLMGDYYAYGPGRDRAKGADAYQRQVDLGDYSNTNSLSELLMNRREFDRAEALARLRIRVQPEYGLTYSNLVVYHLLQRELRSADSVLIVAQRRGVTTPRDALSLAAIAVMRDDNARGWTLLDSARRTSTGLNHALALRFMAELRLAQGQITAGRQLLREARAYDVSRGAASTELRDVAKEVQRDAVLFGSDPLLAQRLDVAMASAAAADRAAASLDVAGVYALVGAPSRARELVTQWEGAGAEGVGVGAGETRDTAARRVAQPALELALARIALAERRFDEAVALFRKADSLPDGPANECVSCLPIDLARTFDLAGNVDSTIHYMEQFLATTSFGAFDVGWSYVPIVEKRLGELYELRGAFDRSGSGAGDAARARAHYERFVRLWANAEPVLRPRVADVHARLSRLGR